MANRIYQCKGCGNVIEANTNHKGDIYPVCSGSCKQIFNPHTARERVLPVQTAHKYIREADEGRLLTFEMLEAMPASEIAIARVEDTPQARLVQRAARYFTKHREGHLIFSRMVNSRELVFIEPASGQPRNFGDY
jgi:endogenous inhibitor of DNA gyrase (YacG/DUF329 family)